jgi:hypothetical protein
MGKARNAPPSIKKEGKEEEEKESRIPFLLPLLSCLFFARAQLIVVNSDQNPFPHPFVLLFLFHRTFVWPVATVSWLRLFANLVQTIRI